MTLLFESMDNEVVVGGKRGIMIEDSGSKDRGARLVWIFTVGVDDFLVIYGCKDMETGSINPLLATKTREGIFDDDDDDDDDDVGDRLTNDHSDS